MGSNTDHYEVIQLSTSL